MRSVAPTTSVESIWRATRHRFMQEKMKGASLSVLIWNPKAVSKHFLIEINSVSTLHALMSESWLAKCVQKAIPFRKSRNWGSIWVRYTVKVTSVATVESTFPSANSWIYTYLESVKTKRKGQSIFTLSMRSRLVRVLTKVKIWEKRIWKYHHNRLHLQAVKKETIRKKIKTLMKNPKGSLWKMLMRLGS